MNTRLRGAFRHEMDEARTGYAVGDLDLSFHHLERAHILGQRALWPHVVTHWWMLKVGIRRLDSREIRGQLARLIAAVLGSVFGWVPVGNTGGANISPLKTMPIPAEFAHLFNDSDPVKRRWGRFALIMLIALAAGAGIFARNVWAHAGEGVDVTTRFDGNCTKLAGYSGAEDIVLDVERRIAYAVGGDRRSFRSGGPGRARIWAIPLDSTEASRPRDITPSSPASFRSFGADLHIDADGTRRMFVASRPDNGHTIEVFRLKDGGPVEHERTLRSHLLKNPNDMVAIGPDQVLVTLDKVSDAGTSMEVLEGALQRATGKVLLVGPSQSRLVANGLTMANGIALAPDGRTLYVAELVGRSLAVFDRNLITNKLTRRSTIPLDAAPDNLSVLPDGRVLIAGHPKLLSLALGYQETEDKPSPSQVFVHDPRSGSVETVFSSDGREIAGSSVAVMDPRSQRVLIGSAFGPHILRCKFASL